MNKIINLKARQILDSRGNPTVEAEITMEGGAIGRGISPSGASTGILEALELRDGNEEYMGKSVYNAVDNINIGIKKSVINQIFEQQTLDNLLIDLDGTDNKQNLGANALLAV